MNNIKFFGGRQIAFVIFHKKVRRGQVKNVTTTRLEQMRFRALIYLLNRVTSCAAIQEWKT